MRRLRFTLAGLAAAVAFVAIAVAALREATALWDSVTFTLTLGLLVVSILLAVHRSGERRAFWLGFAFAGSAYLGASLVPAAERRLLSTRGLAYLDSKVGSRGLVSRVIVQTSRPGVFATSSSAGSVDLEVGQVLADVGDIDMKIFRMPAGSVRTTQDFMHIGHSLIALLLACAGGLFSRRLARGRGASELVGTSAAGDADRASAIHEHR